MSAAARWYVLAADGRATLCRDEHDAKGAVARFDTEWPRAAPHRAAQLTEAQQPPEIGDLMAAADQYARHSSIGYCESLYGTSPSYTAEWATKIEASRAGLQNAIAAALSALPAAARVPLTDEQLDKLRTFLDGAAGEGFVIGDVDAGELFMDLFPDHYAEAISQEARTS